MTLPARCPRCAHAFTFDTGAVTFTASVSGRGDGRPLVQASYLPKCPGCQSSATVPYTPARQAQPTAR